MFKEILNEAKNVYIINENNKIEANEILSEFSDTLCGAYFSPSYIIADNNKTLSDIEKGLWLEFEFDTEKKFKEYTFLKLLVCIKPKYNFLTFYRFVNEEYTGKCINLNLATNTTRIYNFLKNYKGTDNEK